MPIAAVFYIITGSIFLPVLASSLRSTYQDWQYSGKSVRFLNKRQYTEGRVLIDDEDVFSFGEFHDEAGELACFYFDEIEISSDFAELMKRYLQVSLNCLIMLATF